MPTARDLTTVTRLAASFAAAAALAGAGCTGSVRDENRAEPVAAPQAALLATVDRGAPSLPAGTGFVGSEHCIGCHGGIYASYQKTGHARGLRTAGRPGVGGKAVASDSDGDGKDDFRDGLDLASAPAFAAFGAAAPRLSFRRADGTYHASIGGVDYPVVQVYGGALREDYLLRVGGSLYPAPMEWDAAKKAWGALETSTWYLGKAPRFGTAAAAAAGIDRTLSAERRCVGCHASGFTVAYDGPSGEWRAGYNELGVGCESCHGPGREHVVSGGDKTKIKDPRDLLDDTAAGAKLAEDVCVRCHTLGTGGTVPGAPAPVLYPWSAALARPFVPGDDASLFTAGSTDPADYWGYKDNYLAPVPTPGDPSDDSFVAARSGYMQGIEQARGVHAPADRLPGRPAAARCFDCHDPHGSGHASLIVDRAPAAPEVRTSVEDGSLCLACHAGPVGARGPFPDIDAAAVAAYARGEASGVPASVINHMEDAGMPVAADKFQPRETGVGRCTTCHMPSTVQDRRGSGTDAAGHETGGPRGGTHLGTVLWPSASERHSVTNGCTGCHPTGAADPVGGIIDEWAKGDPDGDGRFHGYTPRGEHLGNLNSASGHGLRCAQCHTTEGFRGIVVESDATNLSTDDVRLGKIVRSAVRLDEGITCAACHGKDGSGRFGAGPDPLRIPKPALCSSCHFSAGITFADYTGVATPVHFPQKELMEGTAGAEPPGSGFYESADHAFLAEGCVRCHFDTATPGAKPRHDFEPDVKTCQVCHPGTASLDVPTFADYDGDGVKEGLQGEVSGLLVVLKGAILTGDAAVTFDGTGFRRNGVPGLPGASAARQRAAYNWEVVSKDGSRGVHNGPRAVRLLQQSYRELTGSNVPGAVMR